MSASPQNGGSRYSKKKNPDLVDKLSMGIEETAEDQKLKATPFKCVMLGDASVGKTCIFHRYFNNTYGIQQNTLPACFQSKNIVVKPDASERKKIKLQVWDTTGDEAYRSINSLYYKKAAVVLLVYSTTEIESLESLEYWINELDQNTSPDTVRFLVAAKTDDIDNTEVSKSQAQEFAKQYNAHLFQTSAKENIGIAQLFNAVANSCALNP